VLTLKISILYNQSTTDENAHPVFALRIGFMNS